MFGEEGSGDINSKVSSGVNYTVCGCYCRVDVFPEVRVFVGALS